MSGELDTTRCVAEGERCKYSTWMKSTPCYAPYCKLTDSFTDKWERCPTPSEKRRPDICPQCGSPVQEHNRCAAQCDREERL